MKKTSRGRGLVWGVLALLALALVVVATGGFDSSGDESTSVRGQTVQRGPLRISVLERGNLQAADSVVLKSQIEGRTTILFLIEEGTWVDEGDLLCELDTSELEEQRVSQEISVQNREAAHVKAKQNHAIQVSSNESDIAAAERKLRFAILDRTKYLEGDHPLDLQAHDEGILIAEEELQLAAQDLEWSKRLAEKGFLESTQLDADRIAKNRSEAKLNQEKRELVLLKEYEHPRQLEELDADVEEAQRELERVKLRARARIVDYEAEVRTSEAQFDLEREKLTKLDTQIANAKIFAPRPGMVVYWQESNRWGGSDDPLQEGAEVRERQELITLPSAGTMVAQASLHESVLEQVRLGMPCLVTVDAVPDLTFRGRVGFKAVLPDQVSRWVNPDLRVYRTEIVLDGSDERLRPGMSCSVEIVVDELDETLFIPLQAIFLDAGSTVAFVERGEGFEMRSIESGLNDGKWVEVRSGLEEGEVVLLSEPPGANLRREAMEESTGEWPAASEYAGGESTPKKDDPKDQKGMPSAEERAKWLESRGGGGKPGEGASRPRSGAGTTGSTN